MKETKNDIIPAYYFKRVAGEQFDGPFAAEINKALVAGAKAGQTSVSVKLPPAYRMLDKKGNELRQKMESALIDRNYTVEYRDAAGGYWWKKDVSDVEVDSPGWRKDMEKAEKSKPHRVVIEPKERDW